MHERIEHNEEYVPCVQDDRQVGLFGPPAPSDSIVVQNDDLLTIHAAARLTGVSRASVLSWIRNGFIRAETSPHGWMVRASDLENARSGADEARLGRIADTDIYEDSAALVADAEQTSEHSKTLAAQPGVVRQPGERLGDAFLVPLAEFVRDQADVVQEQAETIGWLQAELRRARQKLEAAEDQVRSASTLESVQAESAQVAEPQAVPDEQVAATSFDPFEDAVPQLAGDDKLDLETSAMYEVIAEDPFSEEAARLRMMIAETERKITDLWTEQTQQQARSRVRNTPEDSWLRRLLGSRKRQGAT